MDPLVSAAEMASLAVFAESAMQTEVSIYHKSSDENSYSDDQVTYPTEPDAVVLGWFRNQPDYQLTEEFSALQHVEDGRLFLPLGTALSRGDKVVVMGTNWFVIDTNLESTYRVLMRVSLRREG